MYEGYLQHDAQEVLQCILGYIQEACETIRKEQHLEKVDDNVAEVKLETVVDPVCSSGVVTEEDSQVSGKRKSDTEAGNAKKKPKSVKSKKTDAEEDCVSSRKPFTRSKRKSSTEITMDSTQDKDGEEEDEGGTKKQNGEEEGGSDGEGKVEKASKEVEGKRKKRAKLSWLRPSGKQPSIFSKFRSVGKISSNTGAKNQPEAEQEEDLGNNRSPNTGKTIQELSTENTAKDKKAVKSPGMKLLYGTWRMGVI